MDPRHPELAVTRLKELIEQYDRVERDMAKATVASNLGQLEREGGLVVQEICLVAPRLHEAMMQASRQRRHQLSMGLVNETPEKVDIPKPDVNEMPEKVNISKEKPKKRGRKKKTEECKEK